MSQTRKQKTRNKRAARLKAMVPIEVLTKEYQNIQNSRRAALSHCSKEFEDFLCQSDDAQRLLSERDKEPGTGNQLINYEKEDATEEPPPPQNPLITIKRGRLKRKDCALNPDLYMKNKSTNKRNDETKYKCEICEKAFVTVAKLEVHHQCHLPKEEKEALKKYHCEYCARTFKELNKLNTHRNFKHLKEYKHICEICGKPFINSSELKRHATLSHTQKQTCTICGKQVLNIELHFKDVHENSPKTCAICNEVLPNQKKLNKHRYLKHPFQIYECEICEKTYSEKFCYKKHMNEKHDVVIQEDLIY